MTKDPSTYRALFIIIERSTIVLEDVINTDEILASHLSEIKLNQKDKIFENKDQPIQQISEKIKQKKLLNDDKKDINLFNKNKPKIKNNKYKNINNLDSTISETKKNQKKKSKKIKTGLFTKQKCLIKFKSNFKKFKKYKLKCFELIFLLYLIILIFLNLFLYYKNFFFKIKNLKKV